MIQTPRKSTLKTGLFRCIQLFPTEFCLDIWICNDQTKLAKYFNARYGADIEYYIESYSPNECGVICSTDISQHKGRRCVFIHVDSFDLGVMVHEANHAYYKLCKIIGHELKQNSQEWHSYMIEYIFNNMVKFDLYKPASAILPLTH